MKKILFIVGSHRKQSFNHQLAQHIIEMIQDRAETTILNYQEVPFFNEDIEYPVPQSVSKVKEMIAEADGIWIISPDNTDRLQVC